MSSMDTNRVEHKHCLTCGYVLDNLTENRCPECGRKFNLRIPTTFRVGKEILYERWKPYLRWIILISFIRWTGVAIAATMRPGYSAFPGAGFLWLLFPLWALMMNEFLPFCIAFPLKNAPETARVFVRLPMLPPMRFSLSSRAGQASLTVMQAAAAGLVVAFAVSAFVLIFLI